MTPWSEELTDYINKTVDEAVNERLERERSVGISVPEASAILRVSISTLWRKIRAGEIRTERVLGHVRIPQSEIERILGESG